MDAAMCNHTFRATGITVFLENGGAIETAAQIAAHESPRTTKLYDRRADPAETTNLAGDPAHAELLGQLRSAVLDWLVATSDVIRAERDPRIEPTLLDQLFPGASAMLAQVQAEAQAKAEVTSGPAS